VKKYEGLFILNIAGKEEGIKEAIEKISSEITAVGGKVETVQKMDKRAFSRVADKKSNSGFYVNFIFDSPPAGISQLQHKFSVTDEVFRVLFTEAPSPKKAA
jgi:ribosomal protein S6